MESLLSSDDSCDSEIKNMKSQLSGNVSILINCDNLSIMDCNRYFTNYCFPQSFSEFGLDEENLTKEEMVDLLKALNNSRNSAKEDEFMRYKVFFFISKHLFLFA